MGESRRYNEPLTKEGRQRVIKVGFVLSASALLFMLGLALLVYKDFVRFYPSNMRAETLKGFASRMEYALRYQTLLVFWLMFNILITIYGRLTTKALNPLDETTEDNVQLLKNVLTNSFESVVVSVFSQLIFISFAEPELILTTIPLINIIQFIGRVAFFAGYPLHRAFGYQCTIIPNLILNIYNMYRLGSFVGIY